MISELPQLSADEARQAIAALRGYGYQLYASALAWIALKGDEKLALEVIEDYAVVAGSALRGVQVKDTANSGTITLKSKPVADLLDGFVDTVSRNPEANVTYCLMTTAQLGRELKLEDRIDGQPCLQYWKSAALGADVAPLRAQLLRLDIKDQTKKFIGNLTDNDLREKLLKKIEWQTLQPTFEEIRSELESALVLVGESLRVSAFESRKVSDVLISRLLIYASSVGRRTVTRADFLRLFENTTHTLVPKDLLTSLSPGFGSTIQSSHKLLDANIATPLPAGIIRRKACSEALQGKLAGCGTAFLIAGAGFGKTTAARQFAFESGSDWQIMRLRGAGDLAASLERAAAEISLTKPHGVIIDDLGELAKPRVRNALSRLLANASRVSCQVIATSQNSISEQAVAALGLDVSPEVKVPELTESECAELIAKHNGDPATWGKYVYWASSLGHPQLAQAVVLGLKHSSWNMHKLDWLEGVSGRDSHARATREEIRARLIDELPNKTRETLYRATLLHDAFSRNQLMKVAEVDPEIDAAGEALDALIGPWIDQTGPDRFRTSPLVSDAGDKVLGPSLKKRLHYAAADALLENHVLEGDKVNAMLLHAVGGENDRILTVLATTLLTIPQEHNRHLAIAAPFLTFHNLETWFYPKNRYLSVLLRTKQAVLVLSQENRSFFLKVWNVLMREVESLSAEVQPGIKALIFGKLLIEYGFGDALPTYPELVLELRDSLALLQQQGADLDVDKFLPTMFAIQLTRTNDLTNMLVAIDVLEGFSEEDRNWLFSGFEEPGFSRELAVKGPWLFETKKKDQDFEATICKYKSLSAYFEKFEQLEMAQSALEVAAVVADESMHDVQLARQILDAAETKFGRKPIFIRARARTYFNHGEHLQHLQHLEPVIEEFDKDNDSEMAFLLREAGVSHAHLENWTNAAEYFQRAFEHSTKVGVDVSDAMSAGLLADKAHVLFMSGDRVAALADLKRSIERLSRISSSTEVRCQAVIRLVGHAAFWFRTQCVPKRENPEDLIHYMIPGGISNPAPHSEIATRPTAPIGTLWYCLAEAEFALGVDLGIGELVSSFAEADSYPAFEMILIGTKVSVSLDSRNAANLLSCLARYIDAEIAFQNSDLFKGGIDLPNLKTGKIPIASAQDFDARKSSALITILLFVMLCSLEGKASEIGVLLSVEEESPRKFLTQAQRDQLKSFDGELDGSSNYTRVAAFFSHSLGTNSIVGAMDLLIASVRFVEMSSYSSLVPEELMELLAAWFLEQWKAVVSAQAFRFHTPELAKSEIISQIERGSTKLQTLAEVVLVIAPYLNTSFPEEMRSMLRALISAQTPPAI